MMPQIAAFLTDNWAHLALGPAPAGPLHWALVNGGVRPRSKLVGLVWTGQGTEPQLVVKFPRAARYNRRVRREYAALQMLQAYLPPGPGRAARPVARTTCGDLHVTVETAVPGRPLAGYLREHPQGGRALLGFLQHCIAWLGQLHQRSARPATPAEMAALVFAPLAAVAAELDLTAEERASLGRLEAGARALVGVAPLPLVFNHNDLGPPNVWTGRDGRFTGVIDWEGGAWGPPGTDLIYLLAYVAAELGVAHHVGSLPTYRHLFFHPTSREERLTARQAVAWMQAYARQVGVAPAWLPILFGLCWILHARNEQRQFREAPGVGGTPPDRFRAYLRAYLGNLDAFVLAGAPLPPPA